MKFFIDSNILVYAFDHRYPAKRQKARELLGALKSGPDEAVISTQVMQEFYNTLTKKLDVAPKDAADELRVLSELETVTLTPQLILNATDLHATRDFSFWDSLIVTAAQAGQCAELWSEDMQDGRLTGTLKIVNPFVHR